MIIALAGRPNVGKSSLFNRFVRRRQSLVWDRPGVTRDRVRGLWKTERGDVEIWDLAGHGGLGKSFAALDEAEQSQIDLILVVVDGSEALTREDFEVFKEVRKMKTPILVAVNKSDKKSHAEYSHEIWKHFSKNVYFISAETRAGWDDLQTALLSYSSKTETAPKERSTAPRKRVLILGRPNVGKSSLMNALAQSAVSTVYDEPGTTRDPIEVEVGTKWVLTDTAGVRKKAKVYGRNADPIEIFSVEKSLKEIQKADFAIFVVEANEKAELPIQDRKLLHLVRSSLVPTLVIVNKWDAFKKLIDEKSYRQNIRDQMGDLHFLPILFASAKTGFRVQRILEGLETLEKSVKRVSTSKLNQWLQEVLLKKPPRVARKGVTSDRKRTATQYLKFHYVTQISERPMSFCFFCNAPYAVAEDDKRFLSNHLRISFKLQGIPLKLIFKGKKA